MKKLWTIALLAIGISAFAQEGKKEQSADQEQKVLERFKDLNLSKEQEQKVLQLYKNKKAERKAAIAKKDEAKPSKEEMMAKREKMNAELKNILNQEQYKKFEQNKKERSKMRTKK